MYVCLSVCPCVKKLAPNLFLMVAEYASFLEPKRRYTIPRGIHSAGALNIRVWEKFAIFD